MKRLSVTAALVVTIFGGCGGGANSTQPTNPPLARSASSEKPANFAAWRDDFRSRAIAAGIRPDVFDTAFRGVDVNSEVLRLDRQQAEFTKPIWEYLDSAASSDRVTRGRSNRSQLQATLDAIENRYGVDDQVVVAIWGMETNYGGFRGDIPVIQSLSTLAYDGRRREFGEDQLVAALRIIQAGDIAPQTMRGSWAGAMGHTQFIPTSYLDYAVDFDGDGRRDVWAEDPTDALASTANYLAKSGWQRGRPWGLEVRLPAGFNFAAATQTNRRSVNYWRKQGVTLLNGNALPDHGAAAVIAPAGARGPAFVIYQNFYVIKEYNNATSYAIGVGHLGDRVAGGGGFQTAWPRGEKSLSRTEKVELQERLTRLGFDTGKQDGVIGPNTEAAIRSYQTTQGLTPDGFATKDLLAKMR